LNDELKAKHEIKWFSIQNSKFNISSMALAMDEQ
jgi:hypothetical protein